MTEGKAKFIVTRLLAHMQDLGGFDGWWDSVDEFTRQEILETMEEIVRTS